MARETWAQVAKLASLQSHLLLPSRAVGEEGIAAQKMLDRRNDLDRNPECDKPLAQFSAKLVSPPSPCPTVIKTLAGNLPFMLKSRLNA
jgi:hypothetical protein